MEYSRGLLGASSLNSHGAVFHRNLLLASMNGRDIEAVSTEHDSEVCVPGHACIFFGVSLFCPACLARVRIPHLRGISSIEAVVIIEIGLPKIY